MTATYKAMYKKPCHIVNLSSILLFLLPRGNIITDLSLFSDYTFILNKGVFLSAL